MEMQILDKVKEILDTGCSCALVTVTAVSGSAPSSNGELMLVWDESEIMGTVGGGKLEYEIIKAASDCIEKNENKEMDFVLTPEKFGMQCGGSVKVFIKVFKPMPRLVVVGGGHIGNEIYKIAKNLAFEIDVFDDREEFCNRERFPKAREIYAGDYSKTLSEYSPIKNSYIIIATKDHKGDKVAMENLINKKYKYLGMIGSRKKIKAIMSDLLKEGFSKEKLEKIYTPVGLDLNSNEPNEIALGIITELVIVKNRGKAEHLKNIKKVVL